MRGFFGILFFGFVALVAGFIGFQAGVVSAAGGTGASVIYLTGGPGFGGLFFLFLLFAFFAFAVGGRRRWAAHGPMGGRGPWMGGYGPMGDGDPRRQWIADAHRRLHEEADAETARRTAGPDTTPPAS